ncbi:MAG TPA: GAF domain-containing protein [Anaerolineales bacterium]|nr:GAF domain-containing protein [Anaerolineales bacterium]HNN13549.1 GAF domain-containing protein [Anaerolineales bacterium]
MQTETTGIETQLKDAVQLTEAVWAVHADRVGGTWLLLSSYHLNKTSQNELMGIMSLMAVDAWLCGALSGGYSRSTATPTNKTIGTSRLFAFPITGTSQVVLVGADEQSTNAQRIWKLMTSLLAGRLAAPTQALFPELQSGLPFDLPLALDKVLGTFVQSVNFQGAWLAVRRGETLDIQAEWNAPKSKGISLSIEENPVLRRMNRSLAEILVVRGQQNWDHLPYGSMKSGTNVWMCIPLVIGQRLIGSVALWRQKEFSIAERNLLRDLAARLPSYVDMSITFSEMASHLRRLGLLNDFVLTISSAQNLDQIARRMFGLLTRAFNTESIALFLRSSDSRVLRDYRMLDGKLNVISLTLSGHPVQSVIKDGHVRRFADVGKDGYVGVYPTSRSELVVPLKYRGQVTGVLIIESPAPEAFNQYDEHLMVVIASHLAGLIEYTRLREEAEGRARSLGLIHEVLQQVIGLNNKKEVASISAELVAQYFKYELAVVLLMEEPGVFSIQGIGGTQAETVRGALLNEKFVKPDGVTGHVSRTGESVLVNDTTQDVMYKPIQGWEARSEICVAIKDGEQILGLIDVESRDHNAFSHNDLIAMESLAGILASVFSSANRYQTLQQTVRQLRETEIELNARMEAQRSAENRLLQAAKLAAVGEMAAGIAHELNNPLTTVTGFSELIFQDLPEDSQYRSELEMILHEARRASSVVRRLLDFSRQGERVRTSADLNEVVTDVIALTRHLIQTNRAGLTLELDETLPWVSIDTNQMKQVLLNLIHNALQAMPNGGDLHVGTCKREREGRNWVLMYVRDSGVGIATDSQTRIFEPFFTTKGDRGGTGLGLSVTYGIVADHGGAIDVTSQPGSGSLFEVWLPV